MPLLPDVPEDRVLSPVTGWTRAHWLAAADDLLLAVRPWASPGFGRLDLPGEPARAGWVSDGLEGFARTFLTAAFRVAGTGGDDPHGHLVHYRRGLLAGTRTPGADDAESWPPVRSVGDGGQPMVESASVALALDLTREWLWDGLSRAEQDQVEAWLRGSLRHEPAPNNWYLFPLAVASFLTGAGRGDTETERVVDRGLELLEGWYRGEGWYSDGDGRMFDHYVGWAMHLYPVLHAHLRSGTTPDDIGLANRVAERLREFLEVFARTFDGNGAPLHQGRSLTYRFAAASSVAAGAVTGATPWSPGVSRSLLSGAVRHFLDRGATRDGVFVRGWYGPHAGSLQPYSGPGSPYWLSKAFVALLAPADHPLWTATEEPVPALGPARTTPVGPPGWLVQNTPDGLVRVHNHGSDHSRPGQPTAVDPLYARLAYSTRTGPTSAANVADNTVVVHLPGARDGVRAGFDPVGTGPGWAASRHRPAFAGTPLPQAQVLCVVVARGAWEVRVFSFEAAPAGTAVTATGWALAAAGPWELDTEVAGTAVQVDAPGLRTRFAAVAGFDVADVVRAPAGTAFGDWALVPRLRGVATRSPAVVAATLSAADPGPAPEVLVTGSEVSVTFADGARCRIRLPATSQDVPAVEW
ncbi:DUF2264 domain-containing protein [Kineococcus sp. NPDC059986]|uniref:DUF2264 domain-containing protein n=1 Tax=Kineococcus sp. NPDC059986 TaxID=3155538 RepID=UPI00344E6D03